MAMKTLVAGAAAIAAIGAVAGGVTFTASGNPAASQVQPVVFGAPLPLDPPPVPAPAPTPPVPAPAAALPTADELTGLLTNLTNPGVGYKDKNALVQGGINSGQGHGIDHELRKAYRHGDFPVSFDVANIQPAGPNTAAADVTMSGPKLPVPIKKTLTFVNEGGWVLSQESALAVIQAATG